MAPGARESMANRVIEADMPLGRRYTIAALLLSPAALLLVSAAGIAGLRAAENQWLSLPFALCLVAQVAALFFLLSRRLAFSVYAAWALVGSVTLISAIKYKMRGFSLHLYDIVTAAGDLDILRFVALSYMHLVIPALAVIVIATGIGIAALRKDKPTQIPMRSRVLAALAPALMLPLTFPAEASSEERYVYYLQGRHSTAFFVSFLDFASAFSRNEFETRLAALPPPQPFAADVDCGTSSKPDVFVILEETQTDPSIFKKIGKGKELAAAMKADASPMLPLTVESFGGGTWITNLSFMTGLSANDFGWRSPYLTQTLQDRVQGALPEIFARCGYRTAAILPLNYTFVNEGPFLTSIGMETVMDMHEIGAPDYHMRDSFYFDAANRFIREHRKSDGRPLFLLIETMFPHSPYEERIEPREALQGEPFSGDPEVAEYLRRMVIARQDAARFIATRQAEATGRGTVVMTYGDHQSFVTKRFVDEQAGPDALADPQSLAYRTYFTLTANGLAVEKAGYGGQPLDIAFLGTKLLKAAGIPGSPLFRDLGRLREICGGRFHTCPARGEIDLHLRRRMEAGLLDLGN